MSSDETMPPGPGKTLRASLVEIGSDMRQISALLGRAAPGVLRALALWAGVEALVTIGLPYVTKQLIDAVTVARTTGLLAIPIAWLVVELVLAALRAIAQRGTVHGGQVLQARGTLYITARVLEKACHIAYTRFESTDWVNRLSRARQDATTYAVSFAMQAFTIARAALIFAGCLGLLSTTSIWSVPVLFVAALPAFAVDTRLAREAFALERANMHRNRQGWYLEWLLTAEQTAKELRSLGAGRWLVALYERVHAPFSEGQAALARRHLRRSLAPTLFGILALYGPYLFIITQTVRGEATIGGMLLFVLAFQQGSQALAQLFAAIARVFEQHLYIRNVLEVLGHPDEDVEAAPDPGALLDEAPDLAIEDLHFTYPGADQPVLRGMNLRVRAGETLAIVGRNGMGKTTLVKLLAGLYPVGAGKITLAGIDVATRPPSWRRHNIGVVFQDFVRFQFSARWNVGIGWCPDADDEAAIQRALEMADAVELAAGLPDQLNTPLGSAFGGRDISGGQWQRIALARLFMRRSRLWILDEPTSAMDPDSEERTFQRFREWTQGRTAIIVAHRFSTVRVADRIAVIDDGRVIELGTHDELLAADGYYARMFRLQAQAFAPDDGRGPAT